MNAGINISPQSRIDRIFLAGFLCFCLFAINGFQTDLISTMSSKQEFIPEIKSKAELEASGINIFIPKEERLAYEETAIKFKNNQVNVDHWPWEYLSEKELYQELVKYDHPAFIMTKHKADIFLESSVNIVNGRKYFYHLEGVFMQRLTLYPVSVTLPYLHNLEVVFAALGENGYLILWEKKQLGVFIENLGNDQVFKVKEEEFGLMAFEDIKSVFLIPLVGGVFGFVVLIIEILYATFSKKKEE